MLIRIKLAVLFLFSGISTTHAQTTGQAKAVYLEATVQADVPRIQLSWPASSDASSYLVYRKNKHAVVWGNAFPTLPGSATGFADSTAEAGQAYEYRVVRTGISTAYGYILSGFEVEPQHWNGAVLLVLDTTHLSAFSNELEQWKENRRLSNTRVYTLEVSPTDAVQQVKASIVQQKTLHPEITSLFLFGRIPVPYSGNVVPDGHVPDHQGAWPADGYYAELDGNWTDANVNNTGASQARNDNVPGDGKFDQNAFPGTLELQIGRVDMSNLSTLGAEAVLLRKYLQKDNAFYEGRMQVRERALIDDNFTTLAEGFTAAAWRGFSASVGLDSILTTDYFATMRQSSCLWSYGCGSGTYTSCGGLGNTADYGVDSLETIFTMTFGSYFGDWDNSNNFLRAALGAGAVLSNVWSGRPHWYFHQMALGESLGFSALQSMNNTNVYDNNTFPKGVHMALLGDPTLKSHPLPVVNTVNAGFVDGYAQITWDSLAFPNVGYFVYRRNADADTFHLLNQEPLAVNYYENCPDYNGVIEYMVRPVALKRGNSGSYYTLGAGRSDTLLSDLMPLPEPVINSQITENVVSFSAPDGASAYVWNFGDGFSEEGQVLEHTYPLENGSYTVILFMSNGCIEDATETQINIVINAMDELTSSVRVFPNPSRDFIFITEAPSAPGDYCLFDASGRVAATGKLENNTSIDVTALQSGMYILSLKLVDETVIRRPVLISR